MPSPLFIGREADGNTAPPGTASGLGRATHGRTHQPRSRRSRAPAHLSGEAIMAMCTKCRGKMGQTDVICPQCGYDFPDSGVGWNRRRGFAYSGIANMALVLGQIVSGIGRLFAILAA